MGIFIAMTVAVETQACYTHPIRPHPTLHSVTVWWIQWLEVKLVRVNLKLVFKFHVFENSNLDFVLPLFQIQNFITTLQFSYPVLPVVLKVFVVRCHTNHPLCGCLTYSREISWLPEIWFRNLLMQQVKFYFLKPKNFRN